MVIRFMGSTTSSLKIKSLADWDRWEGSEYMPGERNEGEMRDEGQREKRDRDRWYEADTSPGQRRGRISEGDSRDRT